MDNLNHILVVDDDDRIRVLLKEYLNENKFIVSTARNSDEAKVKLDHFKFDLIILDVMMPGQNGYELTKEIKNKICPPIILLTAKGEVESRIRGLELGADDYIGKPFEPIYDLARQRLSSGGFQINDDRILAIGDGITTDILGAVKEGIDSLFITGGLAALETGTKDQPDQGLLEHYLKEQKLNPAYSIGYLR